MGVEVEGPGLGGAGSSWWGLHSVPISAVLGWFDGLGEVGTGGCSWCQITRG